MTDMTGMSIAIEHEKGRTPFSQLSTLLVQRLDNSCMPAGQTKPEVKIQTRLKEVYMFIWIPNRPRNLINPAAIM
jgi:hypothetical protein